MRLIMHLTILKKNDTLDYDKFIKVDITDVFNTKTKKYYFRRAYQEARAIYSKHTGRYHVLNDDDIVTYYKKEVYIMKSKNCIKFDNINYCFSYTLNKKYCIPAGTCYGYLTYSKDYDLFKLLDMLFLESITIYKELDVKKEQIKEIYKYIIQPKKKIDKTIFLIFMITFFQYSNYLKMNIDPVSKYLINDVSNIVYEYVY